MSWMQKLCEAYDAAIGTDMTGETPLIPVGFTMQEIAFRITLSEKGDFQYAENIAEENNKRIIPCLSSALARTGCSPFPLAEQMKYFRCEVDKEGKVQKSKYLKAYIKQLSEWYSFDKTLWQLKAILTYLETNDLYRDLIEKGRLDIKGKDDKFLTFSVERCWEESDLLAREDIQESWKRYSYILESEKSGLCYVSGKMDEPILEVHPKVYGSGKLISSKDEKYDFQYKGRFVQERSAAYISFDSSMRAHNALEWLKRKQSIFLYGTYLVIWNTDGNKVNKELFDDQSIDSDEPDEESEGRIVDTFEIYARKIREELRGVWNDDYVDEKRKGEVVFLGLGVPVRDPKSGLPKGRLSVTYEQEIPGNILVERLEKWYTDCHWIMYRKKLNGYTLTAPTPKEICQAVLGSDCVSRADRDRKCEKSDSKVNRETRMRILDCMINALPLPEPMIRSAFNRAVNPLSFTQGNQANKQWDRKTWEKNVAVTCALIMCNAIRRGQNTNRSEDTSLSPAELDPLCRDRDYLYGRLLAVADKIGMDADEEHINSVPNHALRAMQRMTRRPFETWTLLYLSLLPILGKLARKDMLYYQKLIGGIERLFKSEDRADRKALSYRFLLGYACQKQAFYRKKDASRPEEPSFEDEDRTNERNGLYGALLAVADVTELHTIQDRDSAETNALRMMKTFMVRPRESWAHLYDRLIPYMEKLNDRGEYCAYVLKQIETQFEEEDILSDAALDGRFLNGYFRTRQALLNSEKLSYAVIESAFELPRTRDAAYGRLLGLEDMIECCAMDIEKKDDEKRLSNAVRFMSRMAIKPETTWSYLRRRVEPYRNKLAYRRAGLIAGWMEELERTESLIQENGWNTDKALDGSYLHEYHRTHAMKKETMKDII